MLTGHHFNIELRVILVASPIEFLVENLSCISLQLPYLYIFVFYDPSSFLANNSLSDYLAEYIRILHLSSTDVISFLLNK